MPRYTHGKMTRSQSKPGSGHGAHGAASNFLRWLDMGNHTPSSHAQQSPEEPQSRRRRRTRRA